MSLLSTGRIFALALTLLIFSSCSKNEPRFFSPVAETDIDVPSSIKKTYFKSSWRTDKCGDRVYSFESSVTVSDLVENAKFFAQHKKPFVSSQYFFYVHLGYKELVDLYTQLNLIRDGGLIDQLVFDLRDYMLRLAINDPGARELFKEHLKPFATYFENTQHPQFYPLVRASDCRMQKLSSSSIQGSPEASAPGGIPKKLKVFHAAFEDHANIRFGGVSSFLSGLIEAEKLHTRDTGEGLVTPHIITPFYGVLKRKFGDEAQFVGFFDQEIDNWVYRTTVYKVTVKGIEQFLIQPEPNYKSGLYDFWNASDLYKNFTDEMWIYYSSAIAYFAALYHGPNFDEKVDVLQLNDWHLGMASALLYNSLNSKRHDLGLAPISTVATVHELNEYQGKHSGSYLFSRVGLTKPQTARINMQALFQIFSRASNTVSKAIAAEMRSLDESIGFGLGHLFEKLSSIKRFQGITNGIEVAEFDVSQSLGKLNVSPDLNDLFLKKSEAKQVLFKSGLIGSETKDLFLYVGRFSKEKGIDVLPYLSETLIKNHNAQVVVMGSLVDPSMQPIITQLEKMSQDPGYAGLLKVYSNVQRDQLALLPEAEAKKGLLIRFASDFTIVPSIEEACGLVPIEAMALGSGVFTSYVHGLKDLCKPLDGMDQNGAFHDIKSFTCVSFERSSRPESTYTNIEHSLHHALSQWNTLSEAEKEASQKRWIQEAKRFAWAKSGGSMDLYYDLYLRSLTQDTPEEAEIRNNLIETYVNHL